VIAELIENERKEQADVNKHIFLPDYFQGRSFAKNQRSRPTNKVETQGLNWFSWIHAMKEV
jgi:hypothetical protein